MHIFTLILINMVLPPMRSEKGGANMLRALSFFKSTSIIYDVSRMRRYGRNILQWRKIKTKSMNSTQW